MHSQKLHPFNLDAIVLLPDHLHLLMTLPGGDSAYCLRVNSIKSTFTRSFLASGGHEQLRTPSRLRQRARGVWQRRFWEHTIRDEDDRNHHVDYIHYNPVKHGHADCPHAWPHSSFRRYVREGRYERNWYCQCEVKVPVGNIFDKIGGLAGE